jgi:hypothetical protein
MKETGQVRGPRQVLEARYAYYRRCQAVKKNGEQCKGPAIKGAQICCKHGLQREMQERWRRQRESLGLPGRFADRKSVLNALGVVGQALMEDRIDEKLAGRMMWELGMAGRYMAGANRFPGEPRSQIHRQIATSDHRDMGAPARRDRALSGTRDIAALSKATAGGGCATESQQGRAVVKSTGMRPERVKETATEGPAPVFASEVALSTAELRRMTREDIEAYVMRSLAAAAAGKTEPPAVQPASDQRLPNREVLKTT